MEGLVYPPKERPIIALDYDQTCTTNIQFWRNFCRLATLAGYDVMIVTARHPERLEEPKLYFEGVVSRIIATSHQAKLPFCKTLGISPAIWIDDQPWNVHLNINGTVPDFESMSALVPEFGKDIASYLFPKIAPILIKGYGFFYTDCRYEVSPLLHSFHRTKAGAYRAMRKHLLNVWEKERFQHGMLERKYKRMAIFQPLRTAEWHIKPHVLEIHE